MELPEDTTLSFISYGIFKPGELGFLRLKPFVDTVATLTIHKQLMVRDGIPILDWQQNCSQGTEGFLISFSAKDQMAAYKAIADLEPENQYRWEVASAPRRANILVGRSPTKGSVPFDSYDGDTQWNGKKDALFTVALEVVEETRRKNSEFRGDLKPMLRLQMAYLLLWSAIERYATLRYSMSSNPTRKISQIATELAFRKALAERVTGTRSVQRADRPSDRATLDPQNPESSILYYYQIRSNATHAGKGVVWDHERLRDSLDELLKIFQSMLSAAFQDSQWTGKIVD